MRLLGSASGQGKANGECCIISEDDTRTLACGQQAYIFEGLLIAWRLIWTLGAFWYCTLRGKNLEQALFRAW